MNPLEINSSSKKNISILQNVFIKDETIIFREILNKNTNERYCIIYLEGMVDKRSINENIIKPLMLDSTERYSLNENIADYIGFSIVQISKVEKIKLVQKAVEAINREQTILLIENSYETLVLETRKISERNISEPASEGIVRGPREGFTESITTNITLLKKIINNNDLKFEFITIGSSTKTKICISYIEEMIRDNSLSIFETIGHTERPDVAASKLLEGRVVVICDNTPFVLTLPFLFIEYFQVNEDYYHS